MSNEISNEDIREYVRLAVEFGVAEIEVSRGTNHVKIRRTIDAPVQHVQPAVVPAIIPAHGGDQNVPPAPPAAQPQPGQPHTQAPAGASPNDLIVKSPIVGTYYDQAKPGDPAFVRVGDAVEPGQVLCIIESMKLMNEIESEVAGTITAKLMENGRPVEYGEALFAIRPR